MARFVLIIFFMLCLVIPDQAQSSCEQSLKQAEELYASGDYENSIQILEKSIKQCHFSRKREESALELLAKAYLEQDNLIKADNTVQKLLSNNPYYELKENNNEEDFDILVSKFDVNPLFSIGLRNTLIYPTFKTSKTYFILDNVDYGVPYITPKKVLLYYVWAEYEFKKNISFNADVIGYGLNYNRILSNKNNGWLLNYSEHLSLLEIPLYFKKYIKLGKIVSFYGSAGAGYLRILKATGTASATYEKEDVFNGSKTALSSTEIIDVTPLRNKNSFSWLGGGGIGIKFKGLGIFLDVRYTGGINSLSNSANRFGSAILVNNFFYIDNAFKLNKFEAGISLSYTLKNAIKKVR